MEIHRHFVTDLVDSFCVMNADNYNCGVKKKIREQIQSRNAMM